MSAPSMKAVIMAGGEGTRLRPLTSNAPKPMMPLANRPMMEHVIGLLRRHGFTEVVVTVAFMANTIRNYFGDGSEFGVSIKYAVEETPLGTAGSVLNAKQELDDTFLVISGDVLTDIDLSAIVRFHRERGAVATLGLTPVENPLEFGIVVTKEDGSIERFLEKPTWGQVFSDTINTGIYVLEPQVLDHIEPGAQVDFSSEVFPSLLAKGEPIYGAVSEGYWEDVGTLPAYLRAHKDILDGRVGVEIPGFEVSPGVWVAEGAEVHPDAELVGPAVVGENCTIGAGVRLGEYAVLGASVRVQPECDLVRSVVADNTYLGEGVRLRGAVVGRACDLRKGARLDEGAVLGDECFVGEHALVGADVKVYPFKTVETGAVVNSSIIWESRGARSLFGRQGVAGLSNVDMTPELAVRVALAYGTSLKKGTTVVTSRDSSRSARMLKRALMAGLNATGIDVIDLEVATLPVTRFLCRRTDVTAGVSVRLHEDDPDSAAIRFFDADGADITEEKQRKIERLFGREDFRRVLPGEIGEIDLPARALEHYAVALESVIDVTSVNERGFRVVIDYAYGSTSLVMPNVLSKLGARVLAVNPFVSTAGMLRFDRATHAAETANLVVASGSDLGAVIDPSGERLTLIDDQGNVLSDDEALLALLDLVAGRLLGDTVALPVAVTSKAERMMAERGVKVRWTQMSAPALMAAADAEGVGFAGDQHGGFILPGFLPAFDAAASLVKVLDLLATRDQPLSRIRAGLPSVHLARDTVVTPWEQKGLVMRTLVEQAKDRRVDLVDGVKVHHDDGWALVLPDPSEPVTHVWAEGADDASARQLAQEYVRRIRQLVR